jgi:hypothetical protein
MPDWGPCHREVIVKLRAIGYDIRKVAGVRSLRVDTCRENRARRNRYGYAGRDHY